MPLKSGQKHSGSFKPGVKHPKWKGGVTKINDKIRSSSHFKQWRKKLFERDNYSCVKCGSNKQLHPHHIKHLSDIIKENNITTMEEAHNCNELWDISLSETLCAECHEKLHPNIVFSHRRNNKYQCTYCKKIFKRSSKNKPQYENRFCNQICFLLFKKEKFARI